MSKSTSLPGEKQQLARLAEVQRVGREEVGKAPLECVVVESDWPEYEPTWEAIEARMTGAQPVPNDEYIGWYCAHCERGVDASEVTYNEQHTVCGRVITDDKPPKPAPSVPDGWLRAIDEALVVANVGVANESDTYEQAKAKLDSLIGFHVDVATDPAVNGGWKLVPSVPDAWLPVPEKHPTFDPVDLQLSDGSVLCGCVPQSDGDYWWEGPSGEVFIDPKYASVTHWRLTAAPEAKP